MMFSKLFTILMVSCILTLKLAAQDPQSEMDKLLKRGKLVVSMVKKDQPPFFYTTPEGEFKGYDVELARGIANELGVEVVFDRTAESFNDTVRLVAEGKADIVISKLSRTLTRAKKILYTKPYLVLRQALLINRFELAKIGEETPYSVKKTLLNLDQTIGVIGNSSYVTYARRYFPKAKVVEYPSWSAVIDGIKNQETFMIYRDELEISKVLREDPKLQLSLKAVQLESNLDKIAMAINQNNPMLVYWINQYLDTNYKRSTVSEILDTYSDIFHKKD